MKSSLIPDIQTVQIGESRWNGIRV